jgi:hypothetical protein
MALQKRNLDRKATCNETTQSLSFRQYN